MRGRYSAIGLKPDLIWRCFGDARRDQPRRAPGPPRPSSPARTTASARCARLIQESRIAVPDGLPPIAAGLFGFMAYDMVRLMERLPDANPDTIGIPDAVFTRPTVVAVFDNIGDQVTVVTPVWPAPGLGARAAYDLARERLADVVADFDRGLPHRPLDRHAGPAAGAALQRDAASATMRWSSRPRSTSARATSSRSCPRSASACRSRCRRSRSTARCAASIRRRSCSSSISTASRWSARARRSWCGCATAPCRSARSPAPAGAAPPAPRTRRSRPTCWPTRRSWPST